MWKNLKTKKIRLAYQFICIGVVSSFVLGATLLRSNKNVLLLSLYEELMPHMHGISHIGILKENKNFKNKIGYISPLLKYLSTFSFLKGENKYVKLLPKLEIDIPFDELQNIKNDRIDSIKRGYLSDPSWVKGTVSDGKKKVKVNIRLKGDFGSHWLANRRFSLRLKTKKGPGDLNTPSILGMRTFSLQKLSTRDYPYENIFQELIKKLGFIAVDHKIVKVYFNGDYWGLMDMQEHFGITMLERNKKKESLIFTFNDDIGMAYVEEVSNPISYNNYWLNHPRLFYRLTGKSFEELNEAEKSQYLYIVSNLKKPKYQKILFSKRHLEEASDLLNIWGNFHPISLQNAKFYLNPFTLKLEPLMADQGSFLNLDFGFRDGMKEFTKGFIKADFKNNINDNYKKKVINILSKYELSYETSKNLFPNNPPISVEIPRNNNDNSFLKFHSAKENTYEIYSDNIYCNFKENFLPKNFPAITANLINNQLQIQPLICGEIHLKEAKICSNKYPLNQFIRPNKISIDKPEIVEIKSLDSNTKFNCNKNNKIYYKFNGINKNSNILFIGNSESNINPLSNIEIPSFIKNIGPNKFLIKRGNYYIKKPIVLHGELNISEGSILNFSENSYLIVKGSLKVDGTRNNIVKMTSINNASYWKGVYVYNENKEKSHSSISNLEVSNLAATELNVLNLTGGITFYNADLKINNLKIDNINAEDALNIVNSKVKINEIDIQNTSSDGLDCDFCEGSIDGVKLLEIGGDGIDLSGSKLSLNINIANKIKDKVVSIGEESNAKVNINYVRNSYVAVAVKDGSESIIELNDIETNGPFVITYNKKDFYTKNTNALVTSNRFNFEYVNRKFLAGIENSLNVNGIKIKKSNIDLKKLYKEGAMKK